MKFTAEMARQLADKHFLSKVAAEWADNHVGPTARDAAAGGEHEAYVKVPELASDEFKDALARVLEGGGYFFSWLSDGRLWVSWRTARGAW